MRSKCQREDECGFARNSIFSVWLYLMDGERNSYFSKSPGHFICSICHPDSSTRRVPFNHLAFFWKPPPSRRRCDGAFLKAFLTNLLNDRRAGMSWRGSAGPVLLAGVCEEQFNCCIDLKALGGVRAFFQHRNGGKNLTGLTGYGPGSFIWTPFAALKISGGVYRADVSQPRGGAVYRLICGEGFVLETEMFLGFR